MSDSELPASAGSALRPLEREDDYREWQRRNEMLADSIRASQSAGTSFVGALSYAIGRGKAEGFIEHNNQAQRQPPTAASERKGNDE